MKRKLYLLMSLATLMLFSFYAVAGVIGIGADTAYADAIEKDGMLKTSNHFVVVGNDDENKGENDGQGNNNGSGGIADALASGEVICSLTPTQVAELDAFFNVHTRNVDVNGATVQVATVQGRHLTKSQLMDYLHATNQTLQCEIVGVHHVFIFPIVPQIS